MNFTANGDFKSRNVPKGAGSYVNPFVHKLELDNPIDIIKTYVLTVVLLPFRIICICLCLLLAWILTSVGLYGLSEEDLKTKPITGWRKVMQDLAAAAMRALFVAGSFNYIKYKGVQASPKEAPILCVAPHSTYVDSIVVVVLGPPSIVAKAETSQLPFFGSTFDMNVKNIVSTIGIWTYLAGGVAMITKGQQASRDEAPILVVAPHSSFLDSCIVYVTNLPSVSVRMESMDNKWAGKLINFTQPIYVLREDPNSRQNSIKEIVYRANSKEEWPQIVIFPEGTCTNRSALITFKPGAFYPGVPVQPVLLRYPNKLDTFTWTWEGPGALKLLWLTLTQIHSCCEIEFLPVYKPSEEEKANPKLYAKNVRDVMAKALGVPVSDFTYDDCIIMTNAKEMSVPFSADIVEIDRLRKLLGLNQTNIEESILSDYSNDIGNYLTLQEFAEKLKISPNNTLTEQLFSILDTSKNNTVYLRDYLLCALFLIKQDGCIMDFLSFVAKIYGYSNRNLSKHELYLILKHTGKISREESDLLYITIGSRTGGYVTFDEFSRHVQQKHEYSYLTTGGKMKKQ